MVPEASIKLDMSVADGIKFVISLGRLRRVSAADIQTTHRLTNLDAFARGILVTKTFNMQHSTPNDLSDEGLLEC
jgi:hypothetical protein